MSPSNKDSNNKVERIYFTAAFKQSIDDKYANKSEYKIVTEIKGGRYPVLVAQSQI